MGVDIVGEDFFIMIIFRKICTRYKFKCNY